MEEILKKANELGHLLNQNEIVRRYRDLAKQLEENETSRQLLEEFAQLSQEYQRKEQAGGVIEVEEKQKLRELEEKVRSDSLIAQFLATQGYYMTILSQVNEAISNPKGEPPATSNIILPNQASKIILP